MKNQQKPNAIEKKLLISDHSSLPFPPPGFPPRSRIDFVESTLPSAQEEEVCPFVLHGGEFPPRISPSNNTSAGYCHEPEYPTTKRRLLRCGIALGNSATLVY